MLAPLAAARTFAMYRLYYSPGAASLLPHLLLLEIGAPHELVLVDIPAGANRERGPAEFASHSAA